MPRRLPPLNTNNPNTANTPTSASSPPSSSPPSLTGRLLRKFYKLFASKSVNKGQFGSAAQNPPSVGGQLTTDVETIQALPAYEKGWEDACIHKGKQRIMPLEELEGVQHSMSYQLSYLLQEGIAEYNPETTYHNHSIVKYLGSLYVSIQDNNLGNPTSDTAWWTKSLDLLSPIGGGDSYAPNTLYGFNLELHSNKMYVSLTHKDGTAYSSLNPLFLILQDDTTGKNGRLNIRQIDDPLYFEVTQGATLALPDGQKTRLYLYYVDEGLKQHLGLSQTVYNPDDRPTVVPFSGTGDASSLFVPDNTITSGAPTILGYFDVTIVSAGTWNPITTDVENIVVGKPLKIKNKIAVVKGVYDKTDNVSFTHNQWNVIDLNKITTPASFLTVPNGFEGTQHNINGGSNADPDKQIITLAPGRYLIKFESAVYSGGHAIGRIRYKPQTGTESFVYSPMRNGSYDGSLDAKTDTPIIFTEYFDFSEPTEMQFWFFCTARGFLGIDMSHLNLPNYTEPTLTQTILVIEKLD